MGECVDSPGDCDNGEDSCQSGYRSVDDMEASAITNDSDKEILQEERIVGEDEKEETDGECVSIDSASLTEESCEDMTLLSGGPLAVPPGPDEVKSAYALMQSMLDSGIDGEIIGPADMENPQMMPILIPKRKRGSFQPYICPMCGREFAKMDRLKRHIRSHMRKKFECATCEKSFLNQERLDNHMALHTDPKPFKCKICNKCFPKTTYLNAHVARHNAERKFECTTCGKKFTSNSTLQGHVLIHSDQKPFKCELCGKEFRERSNLRNHMNTHTGRKPHECTECLKSFAFRGSLVTHMRTHTGETPYHCDICGWAGRDQGNYSRHMNKHLKRYKCHVCGQHFAAPNNLKDHVLRHGERKFKCETCGEGFISELYLQDHIRLHTGERPYSCNMCEKRFRTKNGLSNHRAVHMRRMERLKAKGIKVFIDVDKNLKTPSDLANGEGTDENSAKQNVDKQSCEDGKGVEDDDDVNDDCCGESCDAEIGNTAC